jgi:hypothetical protein
LCPVAASWLSDLALGFSLSCKESPEKFLFLTAIASCFSQ